MNYHMRAFSERSEEGEFGCQLSAKDFVVCQLPAKIQPVFIRGSELNITGRLPSVKPVIQDLKPNFA